MPARTASVIYANYSEAGDRPFVLRPVSRETEPKDGVPSYQNFVSTVVPREQVDTADLHAPGTYGLAGIVFETYSGKQLANVPLESPLALRDPVGPGNRLCV